MCWVGVGGQLFVEHDAAVDCDDLAGDERARHELEVGRGRLRHGGNPAQGYTLGKACLHALHSSDVRPLQNAVRVPLKREATALTWRSGAIP